MSGPVRETAGAGDEVLPGDNDNPIVPYEVGYGKPPTEHRFSKGRSGNPSGRPRGPKPKPKINNDYGMRAAEEYLRLEAYRPVTLREGGELIELPAIQAVFRAMGVSALKGNRFAQRTLADLVTGLEQRDADARFELFGTAIDYRLHWQAEIERCQQLGLPDPEPLPHPDDIEIDPRNGGVRILGPQTEEQKAHYERAMECRDEAQREVSYYAAKYRRTTDAAKKAEFLAEWHREQRLFDTINDPLGPRYQAELKDRSYAPGATRKGDMLKRWRKKRKARDRAS